MVLNEIDEGCGVTWNSAFCLLPSADWRSGRWLSPDPLGGDLTNPQSLNRYAYALNNPATLTDPLGLSGVKIYMAPPTDDFYDFGEAGGGDFNPGDPCSDIGYSDANASCEGPGGFFNGVPIPPIFGGAGGGGSGGTVSGGGTTGASGGPPPTSTTSAGGPCNGEQCPPQDLNLELIGAAGGALAAIVAAELAASGPANPGGANGAYGACESRVLGAINKAFGTNFGPGDVVNQFSQGGGLNLIISTANLTVPLAAPQFNAISALGRLPLNPLSYVFGYGPTLHVTGPTVFDPRAQFANSNNGGALSLLFTAHLDTAYAYNPIGLVLHVIIDLLGVGRSPCP